MKSILEQVYKSYFSPSDWDAHCNIVLNNRMRDCRKQFSSLLQHLDAASQADWSYALEAYTQRQINELPEMFCLGFSLGAQLMIEVMTTE